MTAEKKLIPEVREQQHHLVGQYQAICGVLAGCMILPGDKRTKDLHDQLVMLAKKAVTSAWDYANE